MLCSATCGCNIPGGEFINVQGCPYGDTRACDTTTEKQNFVASPLEHVELIALMFRSLSKTWKNNAKKHDVMVYNELNFPTPLSPGRFGHIWKGLEV